MQKLGTYNRGIHFRISNLCSPPETFTVHSLTWLFFTYHFQASYTAPQSPWAIALAGTNQRATTEKRSLGRPWLLKFRPDICLRSWRSVQYKNQMNSVKKNLVAPRKPKHRIDILSGIPGLQFRITHYTTQKSTDTRPFFHISNRSPMRFVWALPLQVR